MSLKGKSGQDQILKGRINLCRILRLGAYEGLSGSDTQDATATPNDIAAGVTAYAKGQRIEGVIPVTNKMMKTASSLRPVANFVQVQAQNTEKTIYTADANMAILAPLNEFGDATAQDVVKGKKFTSKSGFLVEGIADEIGGIDTTDATASAENIERGVTAYVNGEKVEGNLPVYDLSLLNSAETSGSDDYISLTGIVPRKAIYNKEAAITISAPLSDLGNAEAEHVAKGKTFTSAAGMKVIGTWEDVGGVQTGDATATEEDIAQGKTAYVNGEKVTGTISEYDLSLKTAEEVSGTTDSISMKYTESKKVIHREGASVTVSTPISNFGDAEASDVALGKVFTSAAGYQVVGTNQGGTFAVEGDGDSIVITTTAPVSAAGDNIIIGG